MFEFSITLKIQSAGYLDRVMATTTVHPRLFEISITSYLRRVRDTATFYSRLFEFPTTLTFRALHGHLATLRERVVMDVYPHKFEISSLRLSEHCTDTNMFPIPPIIRFT